MLTSTAMVQAIRDIDGTCLSQSLSSALSRYVEVVSQLNDSLGASKHLPLRDPSLWKWGKFHVSNIVHRFHDVSYDEGRQEVIAEIKVLLILFNVLLDDVAEVLHDRQAFEALAGIPEAFGASTDLGDVPPRRNSPPAFAPYFAFAMSVWSQAMTSLKTLCPLGFALLGNDLADDYRLIMSSIRFSLDVNVDPSATFGLSSADLESRYGCPSVGAILAHNMNSVAFHTIDRMFLHEANLAYYAELESLGLLARQRELALISQSMHCLANSIATSTREMETRDVSNQIFKIANDVIDTRLDKDVSVRELAEQLGLPLEKDFFLDALQHAAANETNTEALKRLFHLSGAEQVFFGHWLSGEAERDAVLVGLSPFLDAERVRAGDELLLTTHLAYKGRV